MSGVVVAKPSGRPRMGLGARIRQAAYNLAARFLIPYYRRRGDEPYVAPRFSPNPSDNIQIPLNLVMALRDPSAMGRARMIQSLMPAMQEMKSGLANTGFVHFGRVMIVDGNLCIFTVYDGDFTNYIREFIYNVGGAFNVMMDFVKDPPPTPVEHHPDEFVTWVLAHDALRLPEISSDLNEDLTKLPRTLALTLDANPNVQLFLFRSYPGYSTAQVRSELGIGW